MVQPIIGVKMDRALRKLGFKGKILDFAIGEHEGMIVSDESASSIRFVLKSNTNEFSPGLFQFACARCASLEKGIAEFEFDEGTLAGFLAVYNASALSKCSQYTRITQFAMDIEFDYSNYLASAF